MTTPSDEADQPRWPAHERTEERLDFERRYARRFRRFQVRVDNDRGERIDELCEELGHNRQALLNTLLLGWLRASEDTRATLAEELRTGSQETVANAVARALDHLPAETRDAN